MASLKTVGFPEDVLKFWAVCSKIGARARKRGWMGPDGEPIWSLEEWGAFCRAARAYGHMGNMFGTALVVTVHEVEELVADGYDAEDVHCLLAGYKLAERAA
jgi:hypothetical protein